MGDSLFYRIMKMKKVIAVLLIVAAAIVAAGIYTNGSRASVPVEAQAAKGDYIKWVEFNVPYLALQKALKIDVESHKNGGNISWIQILAYLATRYGGDFSRYKSSDIDALMTKLKTQDMESLTSGLKHYPYYYEAYSAVLGGLVGTCKVNGEEKYGLMGFSPIAKTFPYNDYDDFGSSRSYGFKRQHLGHDLMAATGTPVIAVESGVVEALGWNQYGGWRIGIRSQDKRRYYYYAHLRQNRPYAEGLEVGKTVTAGDVLGYVGHTGYSTKENVNNINVPHLHFGLQLVFDESQKECNNEIWVDVYSLTMLLHQNQSEVIRDSETKEYHSKNKIEVLPPSGSSSAETN